MEKLIDKKEIFFYTVIALFAGFLGSWFQFDYMLFSERLFSSILNAILLPTFIVILILGMRLIGFLLFWK